MKAFCDLVIMQDQIVILISLIVQHYYEVAEWLFMVLTEV